MTKQTVGVIKSVIGPVVDFVFPEGDVPEIYEAVHVERPDGSLETFEIEQQLGNRMVRSVAMGSTEGLHRGMSAHALGKPITVPVGVPTLGRIFNVTGQPIDGRGAVITDVHYSIHRQPPLFKEQTPKAEMFETGIKVIDLIAPFTRGGKTGVV